MTMTLDGFAALAQGAEPWWKQLMRQGNALFGQEDLVGALVSYEQACLLAQCCFDDWAAAEDALAALVVSHLNFAEALSRACRIEEAAAALGNVHGRLLLMAGDAELAPAARRAVPHHLREVHAALVRLQAEHGPQAGIDGRLRSTGAGVLRALHGLAQAPAPFAATH